MSDRTSKTYKKLDSEPMATGGMGEIWRVYDPDLGAVFAMKQLLPHIARGKDQKRFLREIENMKSFNDPHIVRVVDVIEVDGWPAYVMEFCPDGNLLNWQPNNHSFEERLELFRQLLNTLHGIHFRCLHRDIKPQNILIGSDGNLKFSDFGLSVAFEGQTRVTSSEWVSRGYSAPEQYEDMSNVTRAADVYSMGAVLHLMLTGKEIFGGIQDGLLPRPWAIYIRWLMTEHVSRRCQDADIAIETLEIIAANIAHHRITFEVCPKCGTAPLMCGHKKDYDGWPGDRCLGCNYENYPE